jgi:hypothetical protein
LAWTASPMDNGLLTADIDRVSLPNADFLKSSEFEF